MTEAPALDYLQLLNLLSVIPRSGGARYRRRRQRIIWEALKAHHRMWSSEKEKP